MQLPNHIAAISSYGTVSSPLKRYRSAISFSAKEELIKAFKDFLIMQLMEAKMIPEYKEELEEIDTEDAFRQIDTAIEDMSVDYEEVMTFPEDWEKRIVVSIPAILTDFHVEIIDPEEENLEWIHKRDKIGIMASDEPVICGGPGEFLKVCQLCDPTEEGKVYFGMKDPSPLEEWDNLIGEGTVVKLIKASN